LTVSTTCQFVAISYKQKHPHIQFTININLHTIFAGTFNSYLIESEML
jgi:hypothetical protein